MHITVRELREVVRQILVEAWNFSTDPAHAHAIEAQAAAEDKAARQVKNDQPFNQTIDEEFDEEISELQTLPEYQTIDSFIEDKIDSIDATATATFTAADIHALARNIYDVQAAGVTQIRNVRKQLEDFGLKFIPREITKAVRGVTSNPHGRHPFAGTGGGGSGFSSGGLGMGGGPGTMGGGKGYNSSSSKSLPMGSRRR